MFISYFTVSLSMALLLATSSPYQEPGNSNSAKNVVQQALVHAKNGQALYKAGKNAEAVLELKEAVKLQPKNADYRNQLATAHFHNHEMGPMWKQLRHGALIDPAHKLIAKGMLAYWGTFDKRGLFNVGTPEGEVVENLGSPDQRIVNPKDHSRTRLVYGFLAADFRGGRLHETLDLRGLKPGHLVAKETIGIQFDGRNWTPAYRTNNRYVATTEFTLQNEKIQNWTELVSLQRLHNRALNSPTMEKVAEGMMSSLKKNNPDRKYRILAKDNNSVLFEWKTGGNESSSAQHEIVRLIKSKNDIYRVAYVKKTNKLEDNVQRRWVRILQSAKIKSVRSDSRTRPTVASNDEVSDQQMWVFGRFLSVAVFAHARKQEQLAKTNLVEAFRRAKEFNVTLPKPFELTGNELENVSRGVDYLVNRMPAELRRRKLPEQKIATYQVVVRTFSLAMLAGDKDLAEKSMVMIRREIKKSSLPDSLIAALEEQTKLGATPDQVRGLIRKLHSDAELFLARIEKPVLSNSSRKQKRHSEHSAKSNGKVFVAPMTIKVLTLAGTKRAEVDKDGDVWINGNKVGTLTQDGEIWANGNKEGELTRDGEVWKAGNKIGAINKKGEVWLMGNQLGSIQPNGEIWMSGTRIGSVVGTNHRAAAVIMFFGFFNLAD